MLTVALEHHINCNQIILEGNPLTDPDFEPLLNQVEELLENQEANIILNLDNIQLINSLGVKNLIKIMTKCRNAGGDLYIVNISDKISQVLVLTKLNTVLNIASSLNEAINQFATQK